MIDLTFDVEGAEAVAFAALPTLALKLRINANGAERIRTISLNVQVRIAAPARAYTKVEQDRLLDLFGDPSIWGKSLKSLLWTMATVQVPTFQATTLVDLPIPCTYDFEVLSTRYFDALEGGPVLLDLLFSGTVFYDTDAGLRVQQIPWDKEARFAMPVRVWKDVIGLYFPGTTWLRLHTDAFEMLRRYRARNALPSWEATLEHLLTAAERQEEAVWTP